MPITITITVKEGPPETAGTDFAMDLAYETKVEGATEREVELARVIEGRHRQLLGILSGGAETTRILERKAPRP